MNVTLYLADCLDKLPEIPTASVDAVITDPPFGTSTAEWDKEPDPQAWAEMRRLCPDGPIAVMGYAKQLFRWAQYFDGLNLIGFIVWYKYNELLVSPGLTRAHQDIAIWGKTLKQLKVDEVREPYSSNKALAKWFANRHGVIPAKHELTARLQVSGHGCQNPEGRRCSDLWVIPSPNAGFHAHRKRHKNEKPLELFRRLVLLLTDEGQVVIDPYLGSGTSAEAALITGRYFIGIEIVPEYYEIAQRRIAEAQRQLRLPLVY